MAAGGDSTYPALVIDSVIGHVWLNTQDGSAGKWRLPAEEPASVGRAPGHGLVIPSSWIPRNLCRFIPAPMGWLVQLGSRARMRVVNDYVGDHVFDRNSLIALQEGKSTLTFPELDELLQLGVVIQASPPRDPAEPPLSWDVPELQDRPDPTRVDGTRYGINRLNFTTTQRQRLAATFRWLLVGEPQPVNVLAAAASSLGIGQSALTKTVMTVRDRVNDERWLDLATIEQLGHYLCHLTRTITVDDLPQDLSAHKG